MSDSHAKRHYLVTPIGRIYYESMGIGDPVVLLHGKYCDLRVWDGQVAALATAGYQVIRCDLRGYGRSEVPLEPFANWLDLKALLDSLQLGQVSIIGSSSGGGVAIDFALAFPERVKSLVLVSPSVNGHIMPLGLLWKTIVNYMNVRGNGARKAIETFIADPYWSCFFPRAEGENNQAYDKVVQIVRQPKNFCNWNPNYSLSLKPYASRRLEELKVPVLIISSDRVHPYYHKTTQLLQKRIDHARIYHMEGCGLFSFVEQPGEFNRMVLNFLA